MVHISPLATSTELEDNMRFPNVIRMVPSEEDQVQVGLHKLGYYISYKQRALLYSKDIVWVISLK